jgi:uncharacterized membrane protein YagU involved in acid resistance
VKKWAYVIIRVRDRGNAAAVLALISAFVDIALHRRGPDHLPPSQTLLGLAVGASVVSGVATVFLQNDPMFPLAAVAIQTVLQLAFIWCLLRAFERTPRFTQTAAAVFGTDALITVLNWPLLFWHKSLQAPPTELTLPQMLDFLVWVWSIDITAWILSRALERPYVVAVGIVVGYVMLSVALRVSIFPPTN